MVLDKTGDELYQLGTKNGIIRQIYSRSQFNVSPRDIVVIKVDIPVHSVVNLQSNGTGQDSEITRN